MTSVIGDIRDYNCLKEVIAKYKPTIVFHLAAQSLVIDSYKNPKYTYETNIMGTVNLFEAIRNTDFVGTVDTERAPSQRLPGTVQDSANTAQVPVISALEVDCNASSDISSSETRMIFAMACKNMPVPAAHLS